MTRLISTVALTAQTFWEKWEGWILVGLCFAFMVVCAAIGESRVRP